MIRSRWALGLGLSLVCAAAAALAHSALAGQAIAFGFAGQRYQLLSPEWLAVLAFGPVLLFGLAGSLADLGLAQRALALAVRALLFGLLALALARPARRVDATRIGAVLLVDVSDSVSDQDLAFARAQVAAAIAARGANDLKLVRFAARPERVPLPTRGEALALARLTPGPGEEPPGARTDLASALQLAFGLLAPGQLKRVAILSDGRETQGDLLAEAARAERLGVRIDHQRLDRGRPPEVGVQALLLPERIAVGESFELRAKLFATYPTRARLRLYQDKLLNGLDGVREVELAAGETEVRFKSIVRAAGEIAYKLTLEPNGPDRFGENNAVSATAVVPGRPSVLIVEPGPGKTSELARALEFADFDVEVRSAQALPRSLSELARYDFFVLADVPAEQVSSEQLELIERYVRDLGGGFMLAGGEHGFGLGGYQGTRMEALMPVYMDSQRRREEQSLALALVIDCSGSMSGQKIELAKDAAKAAADLLGQDDALAVVGFSGEPQRMVRMQSARNRLHIAQSIGKLAAQGGTAIFPALDLAFQDLLAQSARIKHVILLTDGQTQETGIPELVQSMRAEGITVSTVGLGGDVNRSLLQQAASLGGGRAYFTSDPHNVPRIFVRETATVGQNSAVEELSRIQPLEPADFLRGIDLESAPLLRGYIATRKKPSPAQTVLESEFHEPILARWRVGLGWALAWTSDLEPRWAADLLRWRSLPSFFGQLVREHMRERRHDRLPMRTTLEGDELTVTVDAIGADDRFWNGLESRLTIEGPMEGKGPRTRTTVPLEQRAPGRYEARVPLAAYGSFALSAEHRKDGRLVARSEAQASHPYPAEYAPGEIGSDVLERTSALSGGRALGSMHELFDARGERVESERELWPFLVAAALLVFLLDLLLRRVRLGERREPGAERESAGGRTYSP